MSENSYQQLIDDYIKGIQVLEGESLTDYIKRMGGVDYPEKRAQGGRIGYKHGGTHWYDPFSWFGKEVRIRNVKRYRTLTRNERV